MRLILSSVLLLVTAKAVSSQNPGQHVKVYVTPVSIAVRGDTTGISYTVQSTTASKEKLVAFFIDAPARVLRIPRPAPVMDWDTDSLWVGRPMAIWTILTLLNPGSTTPLLYFESLGLPGILTYWAGGDFPPPPVDDADDAKPRPDLLATEMIHGKTVGVDPWPADRTPRALIARLRTLTKKSCATPLKWVKSSALCTKLVGYLDQAEANRAASNATEAKSSMTAYIESLSGKVAGTFATGVTNSGYWLLKPNADIIVNKL
jgi:hypothetical protein